MPAANGLLLACPTTACTHIAHPIGSACRSLHNTYTQHALHTERTHTHASYAPYARTISRTISHKTRTLSCVCTKCVGVLISTRNTQHAWIAGLLGCTTCICIIIYTHHYINFLTWYCLSLAHTFRSLRSKRFILKTMSGELVS